MGATTRRGHGQHFAGDLRRALLDAAVAAIAERGVDAASLRDVARRAGVSHAAPAHHFGDKAGLYTAIATEGFDLLAVALAQADIEPPDGGRAGRAGRAGPVERLVLLGREYVRFAGEHAAHFEVMFRPALLRVLDPDFRAAADRAHRVLEDSVETCRQAGWGGGADLATLTTLAWANAHGLGALRAQGALGRYAPDVSLDGMTAALRVFAEGLDRAHGP